MTVAFSSVLTTSVPNSLLATDLIADDLRPEMAGPVAYHQRQAITPNIDKLAAAAGSVTFAKAYCQQAVCGMPACTDCGLDIS